MAEHLRRGFLVSARPGPYTGMVIMLLAYVLVAPFTGVGTISNRLLNLFVLGRCCSSCARHGRAGR